MAIPKCIISNVEEGVNVVCRVVLAFDDNDFHCNA